MIVEILKEHSDPIVGSESVNQRARQNAHLLEDDIKWLSRDKQAKEVKTLISVMPE